MIAARAANAARASCTWRTSNVRAEEAEVTTESWRSGRDPTSLVAPAGSIRRATPLYEVIDRSGPDHAARFTVRVTIRNVGSAEATATSKGEAERLAAKAFIERFG